MVFATRFPWWWGAMGPLKQPGFLQVLLFRAAVMQLKIMRKKWRNFLPKGMRVAGKVFLFEVQIMRPFCVSKKTWKSPVENFVARKLSWSNMFLKEAVKDIGICWIVFCDGWAASKRYRQNEPSHLMRNKWYADIPVILKSFQGPRGSTWSPQSPWSLGWQACPDFPDSPRIGSSGFTTANLNPAANFPLKSLWTFQWQEEWLKVELTGD